MSPVEERLLQQLSKDTGQSEAEVVREVIKQYGHKKNRSPNPLIKTANQVTEDIDEKDLSTHHKFVLKHFRAIFQQKCPPDSVESFLFKTSLNLLGSRLPFIDLSPTHVLFHRTKTVGLFLQGDPFSHISSKHSILNSCKMLEENSFCGGILNEK